MAKVADKEQTEYNIISSATVFSGTFKSVGNLRIDGEFTGEIEIRGKLVIGPTGLIKGKISCDSADVEGKIEATEVVVNKTLCMKSTAFLSGDISINKFIVEPGAVFVGSCKMPEEILVGSNDKNKI